MEWRTFLSGPGKGWLARFDERTGVPTSAWGPSIYVGHPKTLDEAEAIVRQFFANSPGVLGVSLDQLRMGRSGLDEASKTWFIQLDQVVPDTDIPVWRGGVRLQIHNGYLVGFGVDTQPDLDAVDPAPKLSAKEAQELAVRKGPAANSSHHEMSAQLKVLPIEDKGRLSTPLVWEVQSKTDAPKGHWVSYVDASTGDLINVHNTVRFLTGSIYAEHDVRTVDGEMMTSPVPWMRVQSGGEDTYTDEDGVWSLDSDDWPSGDFDGDYARIYNEQGSDADFDGLTDESVLTSADASQAEISAYIHQAHIRQWGLQYAPEVPIMTRQLDVYVNLSDNCNAYFDGNLNFMRAGSGCNNTGRIADVNYHEWGHGFHYYSLMTGDFDGSISEGIADVVSALNTGDPVISPNFFTSGHGIRELETNRVYPDDWVNEVHTDGLIFAGAMWDLLTLLQEDMSEEEAYDVVSHILAGAIKSGPSIPQSFEAVIMADDDNFNVGDGTPNGCAIIEAFSEHGLGPGGDRGALVVLDHEPVAKAAPNRVIALDVQGTNMAPDCVEATMDTALLHYSTDGGNTWSTSSMSGDMESLRGTVPAQAEGTIVSYYFTLSTDSAGSSTAPSGGSINPYTLFVGELQELYCEDFEDSDGGYVHELVSGAWEEGADDWMWGTPLGLGGDPDFAHSGNQVWGNDLGGGQYNGEYQNGKHNRLTSVEIDVGDYEELVLQYRRWLNVEDGYYDQANILANGQEVWTNHSTTESAGDEHHQDDQWLLHSVPIQADGSGLLAVSWEIITDRGLTMGGWTIDDVCVYAKVPAQGGDGSLGGDLGDYELPEKQAIIPGKRVGCSCASTESGRLSGWLGMVIIGLISAARRRER